MIFRCINLKVVLFLVIITVVGFYSKFYGGPAANWVNHSFSGVFYVMFWALLVFIFFEDWNPWFISVSVFLVTCLLEFLQLCHLPFLEVMRSYFIGKTLLGTTFTWSDFPFYAGGSVLAWICLWYFKRKQEKH
jgi:hypothetical protein